MIRKFAFALPLLLAACGDDPDPLSAAELGAMVREDLTIEFARAGLTGSAEIRADGTFSVTVIGLGQDQGRWWIDGNVLCSRWEKVRVGTDVCARVGRLPEDRFEGLGVTSNIRLGSFRITG